jgi:phosphotransferase system enzyme I (PtsI)
MIDVKEKIPITVSGTSVASGIAIGPAFILRHINLSALEKNRFPIENVSVELERLTHSVQKTHSQLFEISSHLENNGDVASIFNVQMGMLADTAFMQEIVEIVKDQNVNIEFALANQIKVLEEKFNTVDNEYMRSRILDIQDVYHRILRNLLDIEHVRSNCLKRITEPVVLVAHKLLPSDIGLLDHEKLLGIILEEGNAVSHVGILTKSLGIPTVMQLSGVCSIVKNGDMLVVDARNGSVIINPFYDDLSDYKAKQKKLLSHGIEVVPAKAVTCKTADGARICLEANAGSLREAEEARVNNVDGIGLLRSELYYLSKTSMPSILEECDFYVHIAEQMPLFKTTVRMLDLGADKMLSYVNSYQEDNPQLGIRGIRYLLKNPDLFHRHLKAVLCACKKMPLRILIPFVSSVNDVVRALEHIQSVAQEEKIDRSRYTIGMMVEVPSVALDPESYFPYIDFISIGTNDLLQYIFAADRDETAIEEYRQQSHPVILKIIRHIATVASKESKEVMVCGEMASNPELALLLIGLGVRNLSMQPSSISAVRNVIQHASISNLTKQAEHVLA